MFVIAFKQTLLSPKISLALYVTFSCLNDVTLYVTFKFYKKVPQKDIKN